MRSNKFRGIGIDTEEWAYGYFTECEEEADNGCIGHLYKRITIKLPYIVNLKNEATMVKPETVGQSTGLPDRNGKEIFDGDVVIVIYDDGFDEKLNVEWNNSKLRFILYNENNGNKYSFDSTLSERITVIGNIHEVSK